MQRNALMRQNVVVIDQASFIAAREGRKDLPGYVIERMNECVAAIKEKYEEVVEIYLIGSYSNGSYVDEFTTDEFKAIREGVQKRVKISDFDFETVPPIMDTFLTKTGHKVHLWKDRENNKVKLL